MTDLDKLIELEFEKWKIYAHLRSTFTEVEKEEYGLLYHKLQTLIKIGDEQLICPSYRLSVTEYEELKQSSKANAEIVNRLKGRIKSLESIPKNDEDFLFTHYKLEIEDLNKILENKE